MAIIKTELHAIRGKARHAAQDRESYRRSEIAIEDLNATRALSSPSPTRPDQTTNVNSIGRNDAAARGSSHDNARVGTPEDSISSSIFSPRAPHDYLMFFTNTGRVYVERVPRFPHGPPSKGQHREPARTERRETSPAHPHLSKTNENKEDLTCGNPATFFATRQHSKKNRAQ